MKEYFVSLFDYENWANKEIADCLVKLNDPPEKSLSLMSHIINAQMVWLSRMIYRDEIAVPVWKLYNVSELPYELEKSSRQINQFIHNSSETDFNKTITYKNTKGEQFDSAIKDILTHLTHHSSYHRGQIIQLIKPVLDKPPIMDYIHFIRVNPK